MFSALIVWYLFLGGLGAGATSLLCAADLVLSRVRRSSRAKVARAGEPGAAGRRVLARGFTLACVSLVLGILCLLADLGRPERFYYVFLFPSASVLTFGSLVLTATTLCAGALAAIGAFGPRWARPRAVHVIEVAGIVAGAATAAYTGVLLAQMDVVALWNPALVALFTASALATGAALIAVAAAPLDEVPRATCWLLARLDAACVVCEALALAAYLCWCTADPGCETLAAAVFSRAGAPTFWLGFVAPALLVPAACGMPGLRAHRPTLLLIASASALVGGFFLRYWTVQAPLV